MISYGETPEQILRSYFAHYDSILALLFPKLYKLYCYWLNEKIVTPCNDFFSYDINSIPR